MNAPPHAIAALTYTNEERRRLAKMLMRLFDLWALNQRDRLALLGLSETNRAVLTRYRTGEQPLANSRDLLDRGSTLLSIHKSLRLLFPHNRELAYGWMSNPNLAFRGLSPLECVRKHGLLGLIMVRSYLNRAHRVSP